jgi:hypothetical protein
MLVGFQSPGKCYHWFGMDRILYNPIARHFDYLFPLNFGTCLCIGNDVTSLSCLLRLRDECKGTRTCRGALGLQSHNYLKIIWEKMGLECHNRVWIPQVTAGLTQQCLSLAKWVLRLPHAPCVGSRPNSLSGGQRKHKSTVIMNCFALFSLF